MKENKKTNAQQLEFRWARRANNETRVERNRSTSIPMGFSTNEL